MDQYEQDESDIYARYESGEITKEECQKELNELLRDYRGMDEEAAQDAYNAEMERW